MDRNDYMSYMAPAIGGGAGAAIGGALAPYKNPGNGAMGYLDEMPGAISKYMGPYEEAGRRVEPGLENQFTQSMNAPGQKLNEIGANFHQSPGFQFALQQALQGSNHAAAAGGMAGSPQHEQQNMQIATGLGNQDYNQWMSNALGVYGGGLSGNKDIYNTGAKTGIEMGQDMASILAHKAQLDYERQNAENQHEGGIWGDLLGAAGTAAGAYFGGPAGAAAGGSAGKTVGGWF